MLTRKSCTPRKRRVLCASAAMVWPWTLTFWPKNAISSSLSRGAPVTKVWRKSVNRYWRYRGNIKLPRESRTDARTHGQWHGRTTRKHIASAGAYRRQRLKNCICLSLLMSWHWKASSTLSQLNSDWQKDVFYTWLSAEMMQLWLKISTCWNTIWINSQKFTLGTSLTYCNQVIQEKLHQ